MEVTGKGLKLNGLALESHKIKLLYVVIEDEHGAKKKIPLDAFTITIEADEIDSVVQTNGQMSVKAKRVGAVVSAQPDALTVQSYFVDGIVAESINLKNCRRIERCYAKKHNAETALEVRRLEPNPFASPERQHKLGRALAEHAKIAIPGENYSEL
jgi:hypothetical protein